MAVIELSENALFPMSETAVVKHTLVRVWSPGNRYHTAQSSLEFE